MRNAQRQELSHPRGAELIYTQRTQRAQSPWIVEMSKCDSIQTQYPMPNGGARRHWKLAIGIGYLHICTLSGDAQRLRRRLRRHDDSTTRRLFAERGTGCRRRVRAEAAVEKKDAQGIPRPFVRGSSMSSRRRCRRGRTGRPRTGPRRLQRGSDAR